MDKNIVKEMLDSIKKVKEQINDLNTEVNSFMEVSGSLNYYLDEVLTETAFDEKETEFRQFVLKNTNSHGFISVTELEEGKFLRNNVSELVNSFLSEEYIYISLNDTASRVCREETEHFELIFKKTFTKKKFGALRSYRIENCKEEAIAGKFVQINDEQCEIGVDQVKRNCLLYKGHAFANKNVLFFGYNIVENPFLVALFNEHKPKKILNIVPIGGLRSFFDNVD